MVEGFPDKLELALKALAISRGQLAQEMGLDKSVVSRWLKGSNAPTGHNLSKLTTIISSRSPGFTMLDWESSLGDLAGKLGVEEAAPTAFLGTSAGAAGWLPAGVLQEALTTTALRGSAYEGFWRSTRVSNEFPGRFVHDRILIRKGDNGLLSFRLGVIDMRFEGWALPVQTQLFAFGVDPGSGVFIFAIFNAVMRQRADVMDGVTLTCTQPTGGAPVAGCVVIERTGLLTDDAEADLAAYESSISTNPLAPEGSVPQTVQDHLFRDVGPSALKAGGDALMMVAFAKSLSRGPIAEVPFPS